ncbi:Response regulator PleD [Rosistilla carotiformis]|uniref:diguanylate cyclase n=1 Tax=Rosistilla carotiformis TaxID=2528017 RepID=A0A518JYQ4_9BACT|nr:diguanylate cyclase response regulator [Rosistilla carotiformis]QDV70665.1 Response regulator PleD [Rosistilla carotiformis]
MLGHSRDDTHLTEPRLQILLVEPRDTDALLLHRMLQHAHWQPWDVSACSTSAEAIDLLARQPFDGLIINIDHEEEDPFETLLAIRNIDPQLAILGLTDRNDEAMGMRMVECGAQDVLAKDLINGQLLYRAIRYGIARQRQISFLKTAAHTDALTGLGNRRALDRALNQTLAKFSADQQAFGFLILDVDHFKQFNDQHGHRAGDYVLSELGRVLRGSVASDETCSRYGGEEFGVLLPTTTDLQATTRMRDLIDLIASHLVEFEGTRYRVTASAGLTISHANDTVGSIIERADKALYLAKSNGRNRGELNLFADPAFPLPCDALIGGDV